MVSAMAVASSWVRIDASSLRSPPATNTRVPAPVTTRTRAGDASTSSSAPASSCMVARAMALRASGRSMVSTVTSPSRSSRTPAAAAIAAEYIRSRSTRALAPASRRMAARGRGIYDLSVAAEDLTTEAGLPVERSYGPDDLDARPPRADRRARRIPLHPRQPPGWLPRPALDVPAVLGLRHRRVVQRALQAPAQGGRHRALRRRRPARPRSATTPTTPTSKRRSAGSASRSTRSPTPRSSSATSRSTRSRRRGRSTGPPRSCSPSTSPSASKQGVPR